MAKKIIGLEISLESITSVVIESSIHGDRIQSFDKILIDEEFKELEEYEDSEDLSPFQRNLDHLLKKLKEKTDLTGAHCYASYPADDVFLRNISTPFSGRKKIKQILAFELEPALPIPVERIVTDFKEVTGLKNISEELWVVSASAETESLNSFLEIMRANELEPRLLSVGSMAAATCTGLFSDKGDQYLYLDIGPASCTIYVIYGQQICFIRTFKIHKSRLTEKIAEEAKRSIVSFREIYFPEYSPEFVEVSGVNSSCISSEKFKTISGCDLRIADILSYTGFAMEEDSKPGWNPPEYNTALAIAWSGISGADLIKFSESGYSWKKFLKDNGRALRVPAILSVILFLLLIIQFATTNISAGNKVAAIEKNMRKVYLETFPSSKNISAPYYQKMASRFKTYKNETAFAAKGSENIKVIDMLNEISRKIPEELDIEFTRFIYGSEGLNISGLADAFSSIDKMKTSLESVKFFRNVVLSSSVRDKKTNKFRFKLKIEI